MNFDSKLFSIILTTYNHERFIENSIQSILDQTYKDFELIVVDDGSTDSTLNKIERFKADPRIKVISQKNQGPSSAFNSGLKASQNKFVVFFSGDDVCKPNRLKILAKEILDNPKIKVFFSYAEIINDEGAIFHKHYLENIFETPLPSKEVIISRFIKYGNFLCAPSACVEKSLLLEVGGMNPFYFQLQDYDLWTKLVLKTDFRMICEPLVQYRVHQNNLSKPNQECNNASTVESFFILKNFVDILRSKNFWGESTNSQILSYLLESSKYPSKFLAFSIMHDSSSQGNSNIIEPKDLWNLIKIQPIFHDPNFINPKSLLYQVISKVKGFLKNHPNLIKIIIPFYKFLSPKSQDFIKTIPVIMKSKDSGNSLLVVKSPEDIFNEDFLEKKILKPNFIFKFTLPNIFGRDSLPEEKKVQVPECSILNLTKVTISSAFQVIKDDKLIIYEPSAHPKFKTVAGVRHHLNLILDDGNLISLSRPLAKNKLNLKKAVLISGRCSRNYYHWLIEYLPKFYNLYLDQINLNDYTFIIDSNMPKQHYEALSLAFPSITKDKIFFYDHLNEIEVEDLLIPSIHTFMPDRFDWPYWEHSAMSPPHLLFLRDKVLQNLKFKDPSPKRIYLSRGQNSRSLLNEKDIIPILKRHNFEIILPEKLSFIEQVSIFSNAEIIIASSGASLSNVLFCQKNTEIIAITSERNKDFCAFSNLAQIIEAKFTHLTGETIHPRSHFPDEESFAHASFQINISKLEQCIKTFL